jgi:hypothetical protein
MNRQEMLATIGAKTLEQELRARGYDHRDPDEPTTGRVIFHISSGEVVGTMKAHEAWEWIRAGCPRTAKDRSR